MSMASLLHPTTHYGPFTSTGLRQRRSWLSSEPHFSDDWALPTMLSLASPDTPLAGPSASTYEALSAASKHCGAQLFERLSSAAKTLKAGGVSDRALTIALTDAHTQVITLDDALVAADGPEADASRQWLRQLQNFLIALLTDIEQSQRAIEAKALRAEQDRRTLLQAASLKLAAASQPQLGSEGDSVMHDSLDTSCSSSVCDSGYTSSAGTSKSGHKLVAMRSRLKYNTHWANKVTI